MEDCLSTARQGGIGGGSDGGHHPYVERACDLFVLGQSFRLRLRRIIKIVPPALSPELPSFPARSEELASLWGKKSIRFKVSTVGFRLSSQNGERLVKVASKVC